MTPPPLSFGSVYEDALARRSHELLALGHGRLMPADLAAIEETEITGKLCDAMNEVLDSPDAPEWSTVVTIVDDQPESVRGRTGKWRPRTDVCVRCTSPRPEHRFRFEAKRLHSTGSLGSYLGDGGMMALVRGYYGVLRHGGMIGYVQTGSPTEWRTRIQSALREAPRDYDIVEPVAFAPLGVNVPEPIFCSEHHAAPPNTFARITHTLLRCA
jgi:hypothetical protein